MINPQSHFQRAHKGLIKLTLGLCLSSTSLNASAVIDDLAPEAASQKIQTAQTALSKKSMVVTANPHASQAALTILNAGGSAVDAAIAAQLVLGLTEPQSSGIGGGAFMLHWQQKKQLLNHYNGRETAPTAVTDKHFLNSDGQKLGFFDAINGGHAVGTPGLLSMLAKAHQEHGKLPWSALFEPAITLAESGFVISPRLHLLIQSLAKQHQERPLQQAMRLYFFDLNGKAKASGEILKNPAYANTLKQLQNNYAHSFYHGEIAKQIITTVNSNSIRTGLLSLKDLKHYQAQTGAAICHKLNQSIEVCGAPPPSSGGSSVLQILALLQAQYQQNPESVKHHAHYFLQASKLAFADRNRYIADPKFSSFNAQSLLDPNYIQQRAKLLSTLAANKIAPSGTPPQDSSAHWLDAQSPEQNSTSHLSIIDQAGNAVSMTSSIETAFGSRLMVGGFILNNQLSDFSFTPIGQNGDRIANSIAPGKQPRSSMAPTMIFKDQQLHALIGSPGGARIIDYVARPIADILFTDKDLVSSISDSHLIQLNQSKAELEPSAKASELAAMLQAQGHQLSFKPQSSGISAIIRQTNGWLGIADVRREGIALGQ